MSILTLFILLTFASIFVALILPHTFMGRGSFWLAILAAGGAMIALCSGCSSTTITETSYAADGVTVASVKVTESSESPLVIGISNTKDKHVVAHIGGWYGNIGVQPSSNSYGIGIGSLDNTYASVVASDGSKDGAKVAAIFPAIVDASKYSLSITKDGASSEGGITAKTVTAAASSATEDEEDAATASKLEAMAEYEQAETAARAASETAKNENATTTADPHAGSTTEGN